MDKRFSDRGWEHYLFWQSEDRKILKRINELIKDIDRNGVAKGIGKPEKLKHQDGWSRRIDEKNRLVYELDDKNCLNIISCKGHYE